MVKLPKQQPNTWCLGRESGVPRVMPHFLTVSVNVNLIVFLRQYLAYECLDKVFDGVYERVTRFMNRTSG